MSEYEGTVSKIMPLNRGMHPGESWSIALGFSLRSNFYAPTYVSSSALQALVHQTRFDTQKLANASLCCNHWLWLPLCQGPKRQSKWLWAEIYATFSLHMEKSVLVKAKSETLRTHLSAHTGDKSQNLSRGSGLQN